MKSKGNHALIELLCNKDKDRLPAGYVTDLKLKEWYNEQDMEVQGARYCFLSKPEYSRLFENRPTFSEFLDFLIPYFERCFLEDPDGEWSYARYTAAWDCAHWIRVWISDSSIDEEELARFIDWILIMKNRSRSRCQALC